MQMSTSGPRTDLAEWGGLDETAIVGTKGKTGTDLAVRSAHASLCRPFRGNGTALYRLVCQLDLEGIVAKRADSKYEDNPNARNWIKIKNPAYSQKDGRADLFKRAS